MPEPFRNEPLTDFARPENRAAFEAALDAVRARLGLEIPLVIGGERIQTEERIISVNPARPDQVVASAAKADRALAERALNAAARAFDAWRRVPAEDRARVLFRAAAIMRRKKHEVSAWMVLEVGKTWPEADADTAEAIDFLEYYGRAMIAIAREHWVTPVPGEDNELCYIPLGVGVVIPPWNFPAAILAGMTTASVVCGNAVVLKPASTSPAVGWAVHELLEEAGVPPGVVNFLPGAGGEIGDFLVTHPVTRFINFTGSKDVGIRIARLAAQLQPGQRWIKRVMAEMGGKDAIIVDETADLDEAARGIVVSAYGYQGQKCSACSRAILVDAVHDRVLERVVAGAEALRIGDPALPDTQFGPVVDRAAHEKVLRYIGYGRSEGRLVLGGEAAEVPGCQGGYFIRPTIFADVDPRSRIGCEEIFGPVLSVIRARDYDDALRIANDTEYGLTGSVYSRRRDRLALARRDFHVGNLYFNRKCTGALVGGHPFGGFNWSGTNAKAGGKDYLLLLLQAKAVSEKL